MKQSHTQWWRASAAIALTLGLSPLAFAGNIPQYKVTKGGTPYTEFSDGTVIPCSWGEGTRVIYPNGYETPNNYSAQGFPIGFDFKFGGRTVDNFVISSVGDLYLGKGTVNYGTDAFRLGMTPIKGGVSKADAISYRTTGDEGNHILTVQFKRAVLNETGNSKGKYSIQIRLHEADGKVEIAFKELETAYSSNNGFDTGLYGWDSNDVVQLTSDGLDLPITVSPKKRADMLEPDSYIHWDSDDYNKGYAPVFVFTPDANTTAPSDSPVNLTAEQSDNQLLISCVKGSNADATVILVSESPFTDADLPVDGETFRAAYRSSDGKQTFPTTFGNAKALYYGNDTNISVALDNIADGTTYYVKAMSVNGYPAYGRANSADVTLATSQAAPYLINAKGITAKSLAVKVNAEFPVIVAATTVGVSGYQKGYTGVFGTPSHDVKVGDEIPGGGKVVYVGQPDLFAVDCNENELVFFRAWTVDGERVSAKACDGAAVPVPSFPYEPAIENYPYGEQLQFWTASQDQFVPWRRPYKDDPAIYAVTTENGKISLSTPALNLDSSVKLTFDFAMETAREAADTGDGGVAIPQGSDPGTFGDTGYLKILGNGNVAKTITSYSGTMTGAGDGTNEDGSSTYETVEVEFAALGGESKITWEFATPGFTKLYLRNIRIERTSEAPKAPTTAPSALVADEDRSAVITVNCKRAADAQNTLVLFSERPFAATETPVDGSTYAVGSSLGNAIVLYYGKDEDVTCATNSMIFVPDYDTDYYVRAISANGNPLYNNETVADFTYHTLADMKWPENLTAAFENNVIKVEADRAATAAGTIILVAEGESFDGQLEDGVAYKQGDKVGNATVLYRGDDSHIAAQTQELSADKNYYVVGYSYNSRDWYGDVNRSVSIVNNGIDEIDLDKVDFQTATIYTLDGVRISVQSANELPAGIYIVNGCKVVVR